MAEETKPTASTPEVRFAEVPADNGLGLAQHTFILFLSIVLSGVIHFGLVFWFGEQPVALTSVREKAHITPENLPPMRIDTFVREAKLERAAAEDAPDITGDVAAAEAKLPEVAEAARLAAPTLDRKSVV